MRIIAGKYRRRTLIAPKGWETRPTSDRLRETVFNILGARVDGAIFADLFAGTGAVGIEALSRGARQVYFAEKAAAPLTALRRNLERLGIGTEAAIESAGSMPLLRHLVQQQVRLDIVYLDPPYINRQGYETVLQFLGEQPILAQDALILAEHSRRFSLPGVSHRLQAYRRLERGEAAITFFHCFT